jgi:hypothetical protein
VVLLGEYGVSVCAFCLITTSACYKCTRTQHRSDFRFLLEQIFIALSLSPSLSFVDMYI